MVKIIEVLKIIFYLCWMFFKQVSGVFFGKFIIPPFKWSDAEMNAN